MGFALLKGVANLPIRLPFIVGMLLLWVSTCVADELNFLRNVDLTHPHCEAQLDLDVGRDHFVEIANSLPGMNEYNQLIVLYRKRDWENFDTMMSSFRSVYETSPLQEAAAFLMVQVKFERVTRDQAIQVKEAEKLLREVLLLYPKSTLVPVVSATVAAFWLKNQWYEKALSHYEAARSKYATHPLYCVFKMGVAESNYMLRHFKESTEGFQTILAGCENRRLRTGAELRLADIAALEGNKAESLYEKVYRTNPHIISKFYSAALYNLGEIKYNSHQYSTAKFYFNEYTKEDNDPVCMPWALKRLADISFRTGEKTDEVTGQYLVVHDRVPESDVGRYSYIHALLMGMQSAPKPEAERRLKVIDDEIDRIRNEQLRSTAFLEKGLVLLNKGEKVALDYLVRLNEKSYFNLEKGPIAAFVREKLLKVLEAQVEMVASEELDGEVQTSKSGKRKDIFEMVEEAHNLWLKGTAFEAQGRDLYGKMVIRRFRAAMGRDDTELALDTLDRWSASSLWPKQGPDRSTRFEVAKLLLRSLDHPVKPDVLALTYTKHEKTLRPFIDKEFFIFWVGNALKGGDATIINRLAKDWVGRGPASVLPTGLPTEDQNRLWLISGQGFLNLKNYDDAEKAFLKVKDPQFSPSALQGLLDLYRERKQFQKAYNTAMVLFERAKTEEKKNQLPLLGGVISEGKLWKLGNDVLKLSIGAGLKGKDLARYYFLSGRSHYELAECQQAIPDYESALKLSPDDSESAAANFRLGKCLVKVGRATDAKQIWKKLANAKDAFWSPLVQNELKLLQ